MYMHLQLSLLLEKGLSSNKNFAQPVKLPLQMFWFLKFDMKMTATLKTKKKAADSASPLRY